MTIKNLYLQIHKDILESDFPIAVPSQHPAASMCNILIFKREMKFWSLKTDSYMNVYQNVTYLSVLFFPPGGPGVKSNRSLFGLSMVKYY